MQTEIEKQIAFYLDLGGRRSRRTRIVSMYVFLGAMIIEVILGLLREVYLFVTGLLVIFSDSSRAQRQAPRVFVQRFRPRRAAVNLLLVSTVSSCLGYPKKTGL